MAAPDASANRVNAADVAVDSADTWTTAKRATRSGSKATRPSIGVAESCRAFRWQWHGGGAPCSIGCGAHSGHGASRSA